MLCRMKSPKRSSRWIWTNWSVILSSQIIAKKRQARSKRLKRLKRLPRLLLPQLRTLSLIEPINQATQRTNNSNSKLFNQKIISVITRLEDSHLEEVDLTVKIFLNRHLPRGEKSKEVILWVRLKRNSKHLLSNSSRSLRLWSLRLVAADYAQTTALSGLRSSRANWQNWAITMTALIAAKMRTLFTSPHQLAPMTVKS